MFPVENTANGGVLAEMIATVPLRSSLSPVVVTGLARVLEFTLLVIAGFTVYQIYLPELSDENIRAYFILILGGAAAAVITMVFSASIRCTPSAP